MSILIFIICVVVCVHCFLASNCRLPSNQLGEKELVAEFAVHFGDQDSIEPRRLPTAFDTQSVQDDDGLDNPGAAPSAFQNPRWVGLGSAGNHFCYEALSGQLCTNIEFGCIPAMALFARKPFGLAARRASRILRIGRTQAVQSYRRQALICSKLAGGKQCPLTEPVRKPCKIVRVSMVHGSAPKCACHAFFRLQPPPSSQSTTSGAPSLFLVTFSPSTPTAYPHPAFSPPPQVIFFGLFLDFAQLKIGPHKNSQQLMHTWRLASIT